MYLPPMVCDVIVIAPTHLLNKCLIHKPNILVNATNINRQAPSPNKSVTACHAVEYISPKLRYSSHATDICEVALGHLLKLDSEVLELPSDETRSSQFEK